MCLYKENPGFEVATEPIKVYKILIYSEDKLVSPYRGCEYHIGETKTSTLIEDKGALSRYYRVHNGLHAYQHKYSTLKLVDHKNKLFYDRIYECFECEIPKGSRYAKGLDSDIVSDKLTVNKLL